jgi:hypothetical protein
LERGEALLHGLFPLLEAGAGRVDRASFVRGAGCGCRVSKAARAFAILLSASSRNVVSPVSRKPRSSFAMPLASRAAAATALPYGPSCRSARAASFLRPTTTSSAAKIAAVSSATRPPAPIITWNPIGTRLAQHRRRESWLLGSCPVTHGRETRASHRRDLSGRAGAAATTSARPRRRPPGSSGSRPSRCCRPLPTAPRTTGGSPRRP